MIDEEVDPMEFLVSHLEWLAVDSPQLFDQLVNAAFGLIPGHDQGVFASSLDFQSKVEKMAFDLDAVLRLDSERPPNHLDRKRVLYGIHSNFLLERQDPSFISSNRHKVRSP